MYLRNQGPNHLWLKRMSSQDAWVKDAACNGMDSEIFYPDTGQNPHKAQAICAACPVVAECLAWAVENHEEHGIWGGAPYPVRAAIKRGDLSIKDHFEKLARRRATYKPKKSA